MINALSRALVSFILLAAGSFRSHADYALQDGDTLAFVGDSITAARGYTKIVEHYTLMRFPNLKVRFLNAGQGGDTAFGCLKRLDRDVFSKGATVVTVAFGVNDIGWGMKADAEHKQKYLDGIRSIIEQCHARKVRVFICSPAITSELPDKAEIGFLQRMTDEGLALAKSLGAGTIDIQRSMREAQRRALSANANAKDSSKHTQLHVPDGVHLNDLGQLAMAFAILKGLGAPGEVSSATIDANEGKVLATAECDVQDVKRLEKGIKFTRVDQGLPLNLGTFSAFNYRWVPLPEGINQYMLTIKNLEAGNYEVRAEGRSLGKVTAEQLSTGINMSSMTADGWEPGGPWDAQSCVVRELVDARDKLWMGNALQSRYLGGSPGFGETSKDLQSLDESITQAQRKAARPYLYHFTVRKIEP